MRHARWPFRQTDRTSLPEALSQTLRDSALTAPSNCGACSMELYCEPLTEITMASIPSLSRRTGGSSPTGRAQEATTAWSASGGFRMECSSDTSTKIQIMFIRLSTMLPTRQTEACSRTSVEISEWWLRATLFPPLLPSPASTSCDH